MKKIFKFIIVLITLLNTINVYASTNTYDRNELENYGVNKNVQDINSKLSYIMNTKKVDASEKIYDFSDILTEEEEQLLKASEKGYVPAELLDGYTGDNQVLYCQKCFDEMKSINIA